MISFDNNKEIIWPPETRSRKNYKWWHTYSTRGVLIMISMVILNNRIYNSIFDTVVNYFLIKKAGF